MVLRSDIHKDLGCKLIWTWWWKLVSGAKRTTEGREGEKRKEECISLLFLLLFSLFLFFALLLTLLVDVPLHDVVAAPAHADGADPANAECARLAGAAAL